MEEELLEGFQLGSTNQTELGSTINQKGRTGKAAPQGGKGPYFFLINSGTFSLAFAAFGSAIFCTYPLFGLRLQ